MLNGSAKESISEKKSNVEPRAKSTRIQAKASAKRHRDKQKRKNNDLETQLAELEMKLLDEQLRLKKLKQENMKLHHERTITRECLTSASQLGYFQSISSKDESLAAMLQSDEEQDYDPLQESLDSDPFENFDVDPDLEDDGAQLYWTRNSYKPS